MVRLLAAVAALSLAALAPALAETKSAVTGDELGAILSGAGLATEIIEDAKSRTPVAHVQAGAVQYWVRALDCSGSPKACSTLVFFANFELGRAATSNDFEIINRFNDSQVFGRAYILPGRNQVGVDYVIELDGGVAMENITNNIGRWADVITAFIGHFSEGQVGEGQPSS
jgi:hypothetical protein